MISVVPRKMPPVRIDITTNPDVVNFPVTGSTVHVRRLATTGAPQDNRANTIAATRIEGLSFSKSNLGRDLWATGSATDLGRRLLGEGGGLKYIASGSRELITGPGDMVVWGGGCESCVGADWGIPFEEAYIMLWSWRDCMGF